ncbi:hypothetical protein APUTEX25_005355, partial [Auxenochlorella protothecoides]
GEAVSPGRLLLVWDGSKDCRELREFCIPEIHAAYALHTGDRLAELPIVHSSSHLLLASVPVGADADAVVAACTSSDLLKCLVKVEASASDAGGLAGECQQGASHHDPGPPFEMVVAGDGTMGARTAQKRVRAELQRAGVKPSGPGRACIQVPDGGPLIAGHLLARPARLGGTPRRPSHAAGGPTSLPPLLAALTVRLARVARHSLAWDPCCGSGSLPHAALGTVGCRLALGSDAARGALPEAGAGPAGSDWAPALHRAAARGHVEVVRALLAAGASPAQRCGEGLTALMLAAQFGHSAATAALAADGGLLAEDPGGRTALDLAAQWGKEGTLRALLAAGPGAVLLAARWARGRAAHAGRVRGRTWGRGVREAEAWARPGAAEECRAWESLDSPIDRRADYYRLTALEGLRKRSTGTVSPFLNLPNLLTISRVFMVPMFVVTWFWTSTAAPATTAALFTIAALTDWLDGYLARRLQLTSAFGAFLDPVADKIMVSTALILLASDPPPPISLPAMVVPVVIMTARELTMSALREWAAAWSNEAHKAVKVNSLGKWKTALQMVAMTALLVLRHADLILGPGYESGLHALVLGALAVLWLAAFLAVWSLVNCEITRCRRGMTARGH